MINLHDLWEKYIFPNTLSIHIMPIVSYYIKSSNIGWNTFGYEALLRGAKDSQYYNPSVLFGLAEKLGYTLELDRWCVTQSIVMSQHIPENMKLFVNVNLQTLSSQLFYQDLQNLLPFINPKKIVFDIIVSNKNINYIHISEQINYIKNLGFEIAIDDVGCKVTFEDLLNYGHLSYLRIDRQVVQNLIQNDNKIAYNWLLNVAGIAKHVGANIILEGIEDGHNALLMMSHLLGISIGQGYLFGIPKQFREYLKIDYRNDCGVNLKPYFSNIPNRNVHNLTSTNNYTNNILNSKTHC